MSTCFWLQAISSAVHLFDAVSAGRTAADSQQHNDSYADVKNFKKQKHVFFLFLLLQFISYNRELDNVLDDLSAGRDGNVLLAFSAQLLSCFLKIEVEFVVIPSQRQ